MDSTTTATLFDVARKAGVSHMTVSRVFSGKGQVAAKTRDRVMEVAEALQYRPNILASGLRGAKTRSVAIVWQFVDPWRGDTGIGQWLTQHLQAQGIATYQAEYRSKPEDMATVLEDLLNRKIDGLIMFYDPEFSGGPIIQRQLENIPAVVLVSHTHVPGFKGDQIIHDRNHAIVQVVDHLAKTGRRRPAFMTSLEMTSNFDKWHTFQRACRERGIADHPHQLLKMDLAAFNYSHPFTTDAERYQAVLERYFPAGDPVDVDALFSFNDVGAMVCAKWLKRRKLRVPEDVAVVGFNDTEASALWEPSLASGDRRRQDVAQAAYDCLMERIAKPDLAPQIREVPMQFIWRESAGGNGPGGSL